ncbi:MAG TPA: hypothetical protein VFM59_07615 [Salinimicrobium sp.]|nr:hypothetical protein [Salinimicrobium sp.]
MKKFFLLSFMYFMFLSCDDGDFIVTDFNFENKNLSTCGTGENRVLYNINNEGVFESIAFVFKEAALERLEEENSQVEIKLNSENEIIYRTFDSEVGENYFCNQIPPINPKVVQEYRSTTGGTVIITAVLNNENDHEADGVPSAEEGIDANPPLDTDADGIPNYLDIDDDNDNVRTSVEINTSQIKAENTANNYPDTDADGTPNYLDADDDQDGTITRYEDLDENGTPVNDTNDENIPNYLNPEIVDSFTVDELLSNSFSRSFRFDVNIFNLTLQRQGGEGEQIRLDEYYLGYFDSEPEMVTLPETEETGGQTGN